MPPSLISDLLQTLPKGTITDICIGLHWTAVAVDVDGNRRCGLASTLTAPHEHTGRPDIPDAGHLVGQPADVLARWLQAGHPTRRGVGLATVNALLAPMPERWVEQNAEDTLLALGMQGKQIALVGHFPFVPRLRERLDAFWVLDQNPKDGDLPPESAPDVLPQADVVAITSMTIHNGTLESLLALCRPQATVMLLGPSTPLSPVLFSYGVDILAGSVVEKIAPVMRAVAEGANFRQVHRAGVRLVTLRKADFLQV